MPPLPRRFGLDPARIRLPAEGTWPTVRAHLHERLARVPDERIDAALAAGEYVDDAGRPIGLDTPFVPNLRLWFHRELPDEVPVPFDFTVLHVDERIVVLDKPHFLSTIPRGQHIRQTLLVKAREQLDLPDLVPTHRLDRGTAGVVLFTRAPQWRGRYQNLFRDRATTKTYLAVAGVRDDLDLPRTVRSHIVKERGVIQAREIDGAPPNAESTVELLEQRGGLGLYRLTPVTGRTHQLRLHLSSLGVPIVSDPLYPVITEHDRDDFTHPLQLLAHTLAFTDPVDGTPRQFVSERTLQEWPD